MAHLITPLPQNKIGSLGDFISALDAWQQLHAAAAGGFLSQLWYRGVNQQFSSQIPGVHRKEFSDRAAKLTKGGGTEAKRLHLEREMLSQFRSAGAAFMKGHSLVEIYFTAQHFGMPTRLLDWSTNPLAGLFFACDGQPHDDGVVYAMDARYVVPKNANRTTSERLYQQVMTMRHPFVEYAVGLPFWSDPKKGHHAHVLPVRPDTMPGRIGQQGSCFTLHMHNAPDVSNPSLIAISVDAGQKEKIRNELHRLNINQFTTYYDLDYLSKEIKRSWGLPP